MTTTILHWIDQRTGLVTACKQCCDRKVPGGSCPCHILPSMIISTLATLCITGFFLWCFYSPSSRSAWESVFYIEKMVPAGGLLRAMHHMSAQLLVFLIGVYILLAVFRGGYRVAREFVFWAALVMGLLALGGCLTGDLLPWTANGYSATLVRTKFLLLIPFAGESLFKIAIGGPGPGLTSLTLTRFFALHIGIFGAGIIGVACLWRWLDGKADDLALSTKNANDKKDDQVAGDNSLSNSSSDADKSSCSAPQPTGWFWPNQAMFNMLGALLAVLIILILSKGGVEIGSPADTDPAMFYGAARPEWSFRAIYEVCHFFPGSWQFIPVFCISGMVVGYFFLIPLIGMFRQGKSLGHKINMAVVAIITLGIVGLTWLSFYKDANDPEYLADAYKGEKRAERFVEICEKQGIPPAGALALGANDPLIRGPELWEQHCASCHNYEGGTMDDIVANGPTAPNLYGMGTREWLVGWIDTEKNEDGLLKIETPDYFGGSPFLGGTMVDYVKTSLPDNIETLEEDYGEEETKVMYDRLIEILIEESKLTKPRQVDDETVEGLSEDDMYIMEDFGCAQCHSFYTLEAVDPGPELTGYGSRDWLIRIISDPEQKGLYAKDNHMTAFHTGDEPILSQREVEILADWLNRSWMKTESEQSESDAGTSETAK